MLKGMQASDSRKAASKLAFGCLRAIFFAAFASFFSGVAAAQSFSLSDLHRLIDFCVAETDMNFENRPRLPSEERDAGFSVVLNEEAEIFAEQTKTNLLFPDARWLFEADTSDRLRAKIPEALAAKLQLEEALSANLRHVKRQIAAHSKNENSSPSDGNWSDHGIVGGSAWWYSHDIAVIWKGSGYKHPGVVCEIYGVPSSIAKQFVGGSTWDFTSTTQWPLTRHIASKQAVAATPRTLVRMLTGIGKSHSLPYAKIEAIEVEAGYLTNRDTSEWIIIVMDGKYHDLL